MPNRIDSLAPFESLDLSLQQKLENVSRERNYKKGEIPFLSSEILTSIFVIKTGKIKSYQLNLRSGREQTLYIYRKNTMFDVATLLDGEEHDISYEILEDTRLAVLPIDFVRDLMRSSPEFARRLYQYVAVQMRYMEETLTDISFYPTTERLIKLIVQDFQPENIFKFNILEGLSHVEIANLLGTVRHIVERHLTALKDEKMIDLNNRKIEILQAATLLERIRHI